MSRPGETLCGIDVFLTERVKMETFLSHTAVTYQGRLLICIERFLSFHPCVGW